MNAITKAVFEVTRRIPPQILEEVFTDKRYFYRATPISIEEQIKNQVVKTRVLVDCNLVGGTEALIPLDSSPVERFDNYTAVYDVPKSLTQGRSIMSVLSLTYASLGAYGSIGNSGSFLPSSVSPIGTATSALIDSVSPIPIASSANIQLIAENVVMVKDIVPIRSNGYIRCILANDEEFTHLQLRSIIAFCKLVELAVKAHIYNEMIIKIDMAKLSGGQELGRFKEVVESYSDSGEMYLDYLDKSWSKVALMNDRESYSRLRKSQLGGYK